MIQPRLAADDTTVVGLFAAPGAGDVYKQSCCATPLVLLMSVVLLTIACIALGCPCQYPAGTVNIRMHGMTLCFLPKVYIGRWLMCSKICQLFLQIAFCIPSISDTPDTA